MKIWDGSFEYLYWTSFVLVNNVFFISFYYQIEMASKSFHWQVSIPFQRIRGNSGERGQLLLALSWTFWSPFSARRATQTFSCGKKSHWKSICLSLESKFVQNCNYLVTTVYTCLCELVGHLCELSELAVQNCNDLDKAYYCTFQSILYLLFRIWMSFNTVEYLFGLNVK